MKFIFFCLIAICSSAWMVNPVPNSRKLAECNDAYTNPNLKAKALIVLQNKCNVCHLKKNKSVVFNESNMVLKARDIHKQVFVKKKMPKGDVKLTDQERIDLRLWLESLNIK